MRNRYWLDGMMGLVVGDALGLPVQFMFPEDIAARPQGPVTGMEGLGCFNMPAGAWSDDSSMALAALDSINKNHRIDACDIMKNFVKWFDHGKYTPTGVPFDEGNTCMKAIESFKRNRDPDSCGVTGEHANGNGALMRIMPVCLYAFDRQKENGASDQQVIEMIHQVASLTHHHLRSNMACGLYYFMIREILENGKTHSLKECLQQGIDIGVKYYGTDKSNLKELAYYSRLMDLDKFREVKDTELRFSGYVVASLEGAVWCLLQTSSFKACLLKVVNYGDDSDTVGAIAGGLAGLYYGYDSIPKDWLDAILRREWIENLIV